MVVGDRHAVVLHQRLTRRQEIQGAVDHRKVPRHDAGDAVRAVCPRRDGECAEIPRTKRDRRADRMSVRTVGIGVGDGSRCRVQSRAARDIRDRGHRARRGGRRRDDHRQIVGAGERHRHGLRHDAAALIVDRHRIALNQRLAGRQEVERAIRHRKGPAHLTGRAIQAVRHQGRRESADETGAQRDCAHDMGIAHIGVRKGYDIGGGVERGAARDISNLGDDARRMSCRRGDHRCDIFSHGTFLDVGWRLLTDCDQASSCLAKEHSAIGGSPFLMSGAASEGWLTANLPRGSNPSP